MKKIKTVLMFILYALCLLSIYVYSKDNSSSIKYLSPGSLALSANGKRLYIGFSTAHKIAVFDTAGSRIIKQIPVNAEPTGLALSSDDARLYVTTSAPEGTITIIDTGTLGTISSIQSGHGATSPVLSDDGSRLFVCSRFDNKVSVYDSKSYAQLAEIPVAREPISAAYSDKYNRLVVANHLPDGPADGDHVSASVDIIDTKSLKPLTRINLQNGSTDLKGVCVSPDGRYAFVTHTLGRFLLPTTQIERGWINTNALSIIDLAETRLVNTVLLDDEDKGAANPWAVQCTSDGKNLLVTHAGTNEVSVIDLPGLMEKLSKVPSEPISGRNLDYGPITASDVPNTLSFILDVRKRITLPGIGPRGLAIGNGKAYIAEYFTDTLSILDIKKPDDKIRQIGLGPDQPVNTVRRGEIIFNDGNVCYQSWQSCATCHPEGRADGLNWDLMNDGIGNRKNVKSMLLSHKTPPVMITGIRKDAETAVRSGMHFIHFTRIPEEDNTAVDEYLKSLAPLPSPRLKDRKMSESALRGEKVFQKAKCISCHTPPLYTDLKKYNVGTGTGRDEGTEFDTPSLIEVWRTAPYLYDGKASSIMDVLKKYNKSDKHGVTSGLTDAELDDLEEYVSSL